MGVTAKSDAAPGEGVQRLETRDGVTAVVRAEILREFIAVVEGLGGDAQALLARMRINPASVGARHAVVPYRAYVHLMEHAAVQLGRPDFGMLLAAAQGASKVLGPIEVAMKNSPTLGEALHYGVEHISEFHSSAIRNQFQDQPDGRTALMMFEILLSGLPNQRQAVEQAMLLTLQNVLNVSGGHIRPRELWLKHEPLSSPQTYQAYFGLPIRFGQPANGMLFTRAQLQFEIPDVDEQLYELATSFIESRFPRQEVTIANRVRSVVERLFKSGNFSHRAVADDLGMHPRTLQRRLHAESVTLEDLRDEVRRDMALHYLQQSTVPLSQVAHALGYSEASVLSRNCGRWFSASPQKLRRAAARVG